MMFPFFAPCSAGRVRFFCLLTVKEAASPRGVPLPMMFALDLYRDFRIVAFAEYARSLDRRNGVAILGDRFDPSLERFARNLGDMLSSSGLSVTHFWLAGAGPDSFRMIEDEAISDGVSVLVSWAGSMVVRDIWRAVRRKEGAFRIWYGGSPAGSFFPLTEFWPQIRRFPWRGTGPLSPWGGKFGGAPGLSSGMQAPPAGRMLPAGGFLRVSEGRVHLNRNSWRKPWSQPRILPSALFPLLSTLLLTGPLPGKSPFSR